MHSRVWIEFDAEWNSDGDGDAAGDDYREELSYSESLRGGEGSEEWGVKGRGSEEGKGVWSAFFHTRKVNGGGKRIVVYLSKGNVSIGEETSLAEEKFRAFE